MMARLNGIFRGAFSAESWVLSQCFYVGRVDGRPEPEIEITPGLLIDELEELDQTAIGKPHTVGNGNSAAYSGPVNEAALLEAIMRGESYHPAAMRLLGSWARKGVPLTEAEARLRMAFECVAGRDRDDRWRQRYGEIDKLLEWVWVKESAKPDERVAFTLSGSGAANDDGAPDPNAIRQALSLDHWLSRDLEPPDFLLGQVLSTTTRMMVVGPTGLGKTNICLAQAAAIATGQDFLHWRGSGQPRSVVYVDGEMSARLMRTRIADAVRRCGTRPEQLFVLSREDFPDMAPLNYVAGQRFIDQVIDATGATLVVFDNVQALMTGDMKDEEGWRQTLPWIRNLTRRGVGQIWVHHTGHDETRSYGTKTREWQLDAVALLERFEQPGSDIGFRLRFTKARERAPHNRADFDDVIVTLQTDKWSYERAEPVQKKRQAKDRALELLREAITREGTVPPACTHIPAATPCVTVGLWRRYCEMGSITEGGEGAARKAFERASNALLSAGLIGKWDLWVWLIRT
jgi:hypothetical protein